MFAKNKYIIWISKKQLRLYSIGVAGHSLFNLLKETAWSMETLGPIFISMHSLIKGDLRILVDDDLVYTFCVEAPTSKTEQRAEIYSRIQELVPENLEKTVWDFKDSVDIFGKKYVQVMILVQEFYDKLNKALFEAKINVEAIEPLSYTLLGGIIPNEPFVMIYKHDQILMAVIYKKSVLWTKTVNKFDVLEFKKFVDFTKVRFGIEITSIVVSAELDLEALKGIEGYDIRQTMLNPVLDIAVRSDVKGKDEDVLNIKISSNAKEDAINHKIILWASLLGFLVLFATSIFIYFKFYKKVQPQESSIEMVQEATESTASISNQVEEVTETTGSENEETEINYEIKIKILNGTKIPGLAKKLADLFTSSGFKNIETGNDSNNAVSTTATLLSNTGNLTTDAIDSVMKKTYPLYTRTSTEENQGFDLVITIGNE